MLATPFNRRGFVVGLVAAFIPTRLGDLDPYGQVVPVAKSGADFSDIQSAINSITDASATKPYTVLIYPGVYDVGSLSLLGTTGAPRDYISLCGIDRNTCIITRSSAPGFTDAMIQSCDHGRFSNFTADTTLSRHVHWDTSAGSTLEIDNVTFRGADGISCGASGGSKLRVSNCLFDDSRAGCHGGGAGAGGASLEIEFTACTFTRASSQNLGFDMTSALHPTEIIVNGCMMRQGLSDPGYFKLTMPTDQTKSVYLYTDFPSGIFDHDDAVADQHWASVRFPQSRKLVAGTAMAGAGCVIYDPATDRIVTTTTPDSPNPFAVANNSNQAINSGWFPRLQLGAMGEVTVKTAQAVAINDILVTSDVAGQAMVNNAQTDITKVLGWSLMAKTGGVAGRVNFRRNMLLGF